MLDIFRRRLDTYKGDYGHVLVIGGSVGLTGAPVLCALGALRIGAGLVTVGVPGDIYPIVASHLVEAMPVPLGDGGYLTSAMLPRMLALMDRADVLAIGPGLSQQPATQRCIRQLLLQLTKPMVVDADALNALVGHEEILQRIKGPVILTPHTGEMARLVRRPIADIWANRRPVALAAAKQWGVLVVLKGRRTVIAHPSGKVEINKTGNPGMATGGMGDVLTGVIAGLLGQKGDPMTAASIGVNIHGAAGDLAAKELGPVGFLASELASFIPSVIREAL